MNATTENFNFMPMGKAIKKSREEKGITREQLAETLDLAPRHIQAIENEGQFPSLPLFVRLVTMFDISVDQYILPDKKIEKTTARRQLDTMIDDLEEKDLPILAGTIKGICNAKEAED